jgi:aspartyl protease
MLLFLAVLTLLLGSPQANTTAGSTTPQQAQPATTSGTPPQPATTSGTAPQQAEPVVSRARRLSEVPAAGPIILPMELVAGRPVVRLTVNGNGPYAFLVSTGATTTMIDEKLAAELLLKPPVVDKETEKALAKEKESAKDRETAKEKKEPAKEREQAKDGGRKPPVMLELELESGTTKLSKVQTLSTDISKYLTDAGLAGKSRGVLSLSAWKNQLVTISFPPKWRLTIEPGALPEDGADTFPLDPDTGELRLNMTIADQTFPVRVEPLMPGGLVLPESMMKVLLMDGKPIDLDPIHAGGQTIPVREARLANSAMLATFELKTPVARFIATTDVATVGSQTLTGLAVTYDLANQRAKIVRMPPPAVK